MGPSWFQTTSAVVLSFVAAAGVFPGDYYPN